MKAYDAVIVGGGIAGCAAAEVLGQSGCSVLLAEAGAEIGRPVRCAEYIPKMMARELDTAEKGLAHAVTTLKTVLPDGTSHELASPGYIIDKDVMVRNLVTAANVEIRTGARCTAVADTAVTVKTADKEECIDAGVIIGADGPRSLVGKAIGAAVTRTMPAVQFSCTLNEPAADSTEIYFRREWRAGYAWFFPKNDHVNVGLGYIGSGREQRRALDAFVTELLTQGRIKGQADSFIAGLIPVSGMPAKISDGPVLLAGDAAGLTDPVTGGGNYQALASGRMAGKAAVALLNGKTDAAERYERNIRSLFGDTLARALRKRTIMEKEWETADLDELIRRTWVAFKEYYRD